MSEAEFTESNAEDNTVWLQQQLAESHKTIRTLLRQISKEQARHTEATRAYNLTVANLKEATRESAVVARERDEWRSRAEYAPYAESLADLPLTLTVNEVRAIRKAMARLHDLDLGGNPERMKQWNAVLDPLEDA